MKRILLLFLFLFLVSLQTSIIAQNTQESSKAVEQSVALEMSVAKNKLIVRNAQVGKRVEIITILGNKVKEIEIKLPDAEYDLNLPKAIYIFKLDGTVRKFIVE
jgi:hypothetical protein